MEGDFQELLADLKNPRAYWGTLIALALQFNFKIFFTLNAEQTADLLLLLAKRIQTKRGQLASIVVMKPRMGTIRDWQLSLIASLPTIGPKLTDRLLRSFGSPHKIFSASRVEIAVRGGIGHARSRRNQEVVDAKLDESATQQTKLA